MNKEHLLPIKNSKLGVIGGSGFYSINSINCSKEIEVDTPYGKPSDSIRIFKIGNLELAFIARHGRTHKYNPTEIPYKANIWALRSIGVRWIIAPSAVGSLQEQIRPLDIVIPDQFIDRTHHRPATFFNEGVVAHVNMGDPFCNNLSGLLGDISERIIPSGRQLHRGGTYLAMEGPAFSTRAESNLYRKWGCSIIGMTNHTEARLAKEAEIAYSSLSMVTDYDCWHQDHKEVSVEMVINNLRVNAEVANRIIFEAARLIENERPQSISHHSLKEGLITSKEDVSKETKSKVKIFTDNYWL
ncbi:MAG: S-methyl-5'-thioadenosine phosphorylase [Prochlorococcus sp. SP3034]|nr:S-methyl-5'-thioadenosine phosphorylase [Prochlorococcus sp. SP3034]|tara:strand:- start:762 stop:1661 length:900 start_codon:yes stop_codon:yes gene_type:complete